eukprot:COSAG04_NODE_3456_length_2799_cov_3.252222_1_plen_80_part_00
MKIECHDLVPKSAIGDAAPQAAQALDCVRLPGMELTDRALSQCNHCTGQPAAVPRLMSAPGSAGCAGAGLPASCAMGSI